MCRLPGSLVVSLLCLLAFSAFGQAVGLVEGSSARIGISAPGCSENAKAEPPVRPQPYTAELKATTVQVLANGTTITRESTEIRAVDSQKRTFNFRTEAQFSADRPAFSFGNVDDPVEGTQINWDSQSKTARVIKLPPEAQRHGCWATDSGNMHMDYGLATPAEEAVQREQMKAMIAASSRRSFQSKSEDLGTTNIEGVEANGDRMTEIIPVGQIGNDKELVTTVENWFAPSIGLLVRQVRDDPRNGKSTMEVRRLDLSEPPLATFQPPEGYQVTVEELHQVPCEREQMFGGVVPVVHGTLN